MELNLPWALIEASQRRWIAEKMNMGQERAEGSGSRAWGLGFQALGSQFRVMDVGFRA